MKAIKWTGKSFLALAVVLAVASVVVVAALAVVWTSAPQTVTVTPKVNVVFSPTLKNISLLQGTSQIYNINVSNPGANKSVTVTLTVAVVGGVGVTATINETATQTIAHGGYFVYHLTVSASASASGAAVITYKVSQTYGD